MQRSHPDKICRNGFRMCDLLAGRPFRRFFAKPECKPAAYRPLPNPLPQGEGTKLAENPKMAGFRYPQSLSCGEKIQIGWKSQTRLGFGILNPLPRGEKGQIGWKSQTWLDFGILNPLSPWERARERVANRQVCFLQSLVLQKLYPKTPNLFKNGKRSSRQEAAHSENEQNEFR